MVDVDQMLVFAYDDEDNGAKVPLLKLEKTPNNVRRRSRISQRKSFEMDFSTSPNEQSFAKYGG